MVLVLNYCRRMIRRMKKKQTYLIINSICRLSLLCTVWDFVSIQY